MPEILTVILLMGIVFAIATSSWQNITQSRRVDSAANQLAADMRLANSSATNQLTDYRIVYRTDGVQVTDCPAAGQSADYCLVKRTPGGSEKTPRFLPDGARITESTVANDVTAGLLSPSIVGQTKTIKFNTNGSAEVMGGLVSGMSPELSVSTKAGASSDPKHKLSVVTGTSRVKVD